MRLPRADLALIDDHKVTGYLLSNSHPAGRAKAAFFRSVGFRLSARRQLRDALLEHSKTAEVVAHGDTMFGRKYVLEGPLRAPDGRNSQLRSIWFVRIGDERPRLVTAYPITGVER
jgi:hypothetical protein